jgi:hypothetical protein
MASEPLTESESEPLTESEMYEAVIEMRAWALSRIAWCKAEEKKYVRRVVPDAMRAAAARAERITLTAVLTQLRLKVRP